MQNNDITNPIMTQAKIYQVSLGWKIIGSLFALVLISLMGALAYIPFVNKRSVDHGFVLLIILFGVGIASFFIYCIFAIWKSRVEIYSDRIRDVGVFITNELSICDVSGFKILTDQSVNTIILFSKDPNAKQMKIALVLENQTNFLEWVQKSFTNLDGRNAFLS